MALKLVRRAKGGPWYVRGSVRGSRYFESAGTHSKAHAEAFRVAREREILDREYHGEGKTATMAEAILVYVEKGGETRYLEPLLDRWGKTRLIDLTPSTVSKVARELYGHAGPATVKRQFYTPLNAVMRAAHRAQMAPLARFEPPRVKRQPVEYADAEWLRAFFEHAHFRIAATVLFLTLTGARVSEACRLSPDDVSLERAEAVLRITKNGKSRRVPLAPVLVDALGRALGEVAATRHGTMRVFGYSNRWSINQAIERVCKRAGIRVLSSHKVGRHAFAARLLGQGASLKLVQEGGGWASISIVSEAYGHLEQSAIDAAVRGGGVDMVALPGPREPKRNLKKTGADLAQPEKPTDVDAT
jgi:integrase